MVLSLWQIIFRSEKDSPLILGSKEIPSCLVFYPFKWSIPISHLSQTQIEKKQLFRSRLPPRVKKPVQIFVIFSMQNHILGIANICDLLLVGTNQRLCAAKGEQQQQRRQQRSGTTIPMARQCCVTVVVVIIIVLVTALAYVEEAVPSHVIAVAAVVAGAAPPTALIVVLPIVGRMGTAAADAANAATAEAAAVYDVEHSTVRAGAIR